MHTQRPVPFAAASLAVTLLAAPSRALAAGGTTFNSVVLAFLAISAVFCILWVIFFTSPLRRYLLRTRRSRHRAVLTALGVSALAVGVVSLVLGKTSIGSGIAIRELEPQRYWQLVTLQLGSGCILLIVGLLSRSRNP